MKISVALNKNRYLLLLLIFPWAKFSFKYYILIRQYCRLKLRRTCPKILLKPPSGQKTIMTQKEYDIARLRAIQNFSFDAIPEIYSVLLITTQVYFNIPRKLWIFVNHFSQNKIKVSLAYFLMSVTISVGGSTLSVLSNYKNIEKRKSRLLKLKKKALYFLRLYGHFLIAKFRNERSQKRENRFVVIASILFLTWKIGGASLLHYIKRINFDSWLKENIDAKMELDELADKLNLQYSHVVLDPKIEWHCDIHNVDDFTMNLVIPNEILENCNNKEIVAVLSHEIAHLNKLHRPLLLFVELSSLVLNTTISSCIFQNEFFYESLQLDSDALAVFIFWENELFQECYGYIDIVMENYLNQRLEYEADEFVIKHGKHKELMEALRKQDTFLEFPQHFSLYTAISDGMPSPISRVFAIEQKLK